MPDVHAGMGAVIVFTAEVGAGSVIPGMVGVDIGCGMLTKPLGRVQIDLVKLDRITRRRIPSGTDVCAVLPDKPDTAWLEQLHSFAALDNPDRLLRSLGSLGGGNHFIETDQDSDGNFYLIIHSGSRSPGLQVARYYQMLAQKRHRLAREAQERQLIERMRAERAERLIQHTLEEFRKDHPAVREELCWLEGQDSADYQKTP